MAFMWLLTFQLVQVKQKSRITQQGFRLAQDAEIGLEETSMTTQTRVKIGYDMRALTIIVFLFLAGCAQVPTQSIELSTTVGRDIAKMHQAHLQTIELLYSRMRSDVNTFIDDTYLPYAIKKVLDKDRLRQARHQTSFIEIISTGLVPNATPKKQKEAMGAMKIVVTNVTRSVDRQRKLLIDSLDQQQKALLASINRSYLAIHQANAIVTGHLSSIAQVHDAQNELLSEIGMETDIDEYIATKLTQASNDIAQLTQKTQNKIEDMGGIENVRKQLQDAIDKLKVKS